MPVKRLPKKLVKRLKKAAPAIDRFLGKMENIDHRKGQQAISKTDTNAWGGRIRKMNISRNFPSTQLAIKRSHPIRVRGHELRKITAEETIKRIKEKVRIHNERFKPENYTLVEPIAYPISKELAAMTVTNAPTIQEILRTRTERGLKALENLKKHNASEKLLEDAARKVYLYSEFEEDQILVLGIKKGKFVFMPLIDLV